MLLYCTMFQVRSIPENKFYQFIARHLWIIPAAVGFLLGIVHLAHYSWTDPDEIIHAVVARNLTKHWFLPTLNDWGVGTDDPICLWWWTKIWLHKPILPLWLSAFSLKIFGISPFAFRLPALLLGQLQVVIIFFLGKRLYDWRVGFSAALMAAVFPYSLLLLYGGQFADIYDLELSFWITLSSYLLYLSIEKNRLSLYILLGCSVGLSYLTKWELGLMPLGFLFFLYIFQLINQRLSRPYKIALTSGKILPSVSIRQIITVICLVIIVVLPWVSYIAFSFPQTYWQEHKMIFSHLVSNVENWSQPWHYHIWTYLLYQYGMFFTITFYTALLLLIVNAVFRRSFSDLFLLMLLI